MSALPEVLKYHAEMPFMLKVSLEPNEMFLVIWISSLQRAKDLDFLHGCFLPAYIISIKSLRSYTRNVLTSSRCCE